ncbi:hypothetical protein FRB91_010768 [Serendipita sp. 411]|nr:hypothetical protein FRC18_010865 [Serendipita sp. 400]KAG8848485.1 hypothetical protein FRB91_010768 [Serendipita sp. 411]
MRVSIPSDIFVTIIRDYVSDDKDTLCALSLVSRSFCDAAQRILFRNMTLHQDSSPITEEDMQNIGGDPHPFKWPKLEFLAQSNRLLNYIRFLRVGIVYNPDITIVEAEMYWQEGGGRSILDTLDRFLPSCLERMSSLDQLAYKGPALRRPMHQAILHHKTLQALRTSVKTHCLVPCKEALYKPKTSLIKVLDFIEMGNEFNVVEEIGVRFYVAGPRRCGFLSHIILTSSASLVSLIVPFPLLYDALRPFLPRNLPDFPHLSSLQIEDSISSIAMQTLLPHMSASVISFILHVHQTIQALHWGRNLVEATTTKITANHLPNLKRLSGYQIWHLIQTHQLRTLRIINLCADDFDPEKDWSALRDISSTQHSLSKLAIWTITRYIAIPHDLCTFTNIVELWYEEVPDITLYDGVSQTRKDFVSEFLRIILPALPKLHFLCLTINGDIDNRKPQAGSALKLLSSSRSLHLFTIQFAYSVECYIFDAFRTDTKSDWRYSSTQGSHRMKRFAV